MLMMMVRLIKHDIHCLFDALQIFDFELSPSDIEAINQLNKDLRIGAPTKVRNG